MSSVLRSIDQRPMGDVKFISLITPCYDSQQYNNSNALLPLTMSRKGELELLETQDYLTYYNDNEYPSPGGNTDVDAWINVLGGMKVVSSLGPKLKRYVAQWLEQKKDVAGTYTSRVSLHTIGCVVSKVQQYFAENDGSYSTASASYITSTVPPTGDNFVQGGQFNNYQTSYIFKTPLVMKYVKEDGDVVYATFKTVVSED